MTPLQAMKLAIEEGKKGTGFTAPNPNVGCVILDKNLNLLSKGHHARVGEAHAEVNALRAVEDAAALAGAHLYVTLEPCAHEGRTPSCAKALAKLPLASVTYGLEDPNPLVAGRGAEIVRAAGKQVVLFDQLRPELEELCEIFLLNMRAKRPFVALKVASSLDGKIALPNGESQWITGESARAHVQWLRGCYDAVAVGAGTFLSDDPRLNSRDPRFAAKKSRVVLFDRDGLCADKLMTSNLLKVRGPEDVFWVTNSKTELPVKKLALEDLLREGITSLFLEGGAGLYAEFLKAEMVDRVYAYLAPKILGEGLSWSNGLKQSRLADVITLKHARLETLGDDVLWTGSVD